MQADPIEKKPFFHAYPGALALPFGMLGCDYHCGYCQNWVTSQALRDPVAGRSSDRPRAGRAGGAAPRPRRESDHTTYNEPLITSEWAVEIFKEAKHAGLVCSYVSNGNGTQKVLDYIAPVRRSLQGRSEGLHRSRTTATSAGASAGARHDQEVCKQRGIWLEIVTLVVPGFNDSDEEVTKIAEFLASVDRRYPVAHHGVPSGLQDD